MLARRLGVTARPRAVRAGEKVPDDRDVGRGGGEVDPAPGGEDAEGRQRIAPVGAAEFGLDPRDHVGEQDRAGAAKDRDI